MADIQHVNITSSGCHEPKHISTSLTSQSGMVITPSSTVAGTSEFRRLTAQDLDEANSTSFLTYWGFYEDSTYTSGSPLVVTASSRAKVAIDSLGANTDISQMPVGVELWDSTSNTITPEGEGDLILARLTFKCDATPASGSYLDLDVDIGGATGIIFEETKLITKDSVENKFVVEYTLPVNSISLANGFSIYITPKDDTDFYDFGILLSRVHKGS